MGSSLCRLPRPPLFVPCVNSLFILGFRPTKVVYLQLAAQINEPRNMLTYNESSLCCYYKTFFLRVNHNYTCRAFDNSCSSLYNSAGFRGNKKNKTISQDENHFNWSYVTVFKRRKKKVFANLQNFVIL